MRRKRYIAYLLLVIGLLMPTIPVFPHHHHHDESICLKHDLCGDCDGHHHDADHHHCCHNTGCLATHFTAITEEQDIKPELQEILLFVEPLLQILFNPALDAEPQPCVYREIFHPALARTVRGLRAPPTL